MRVAEQTRTTSGLSGRHSWGALLEPSIASKLLGDEFDVPMAAIVARREAMRQADIAGKYNMHAAGFSPSGNVKLSLEMPLAVWIAARVAYGKDVFQNPKKLRLFKQEHPEYTFDIRR